MCEENETFSFAVDLTDPKEDKARLNSWMQDEMLDVISDDSEDDVHGS